LPGRLEGAGYGLAEVGQKRNEAVVFGAGVDHREASSALAWHLDQQLIAGFGNVDGYENASWWLKLLTGHG
jgi:hypothetical protein